MATPEQLHLQVALIIEDSMTLVPLSLQILRKHYGIAIKELAIDMGRSYSWVQERVKGTTQCKPGDLRAFAYAFNVDIDVLFYGDRTKITRWLADHPSDQPRFTMRCFALPGAA